MAALPTESTDDDFYEVETLLDVRFVPKSQRKLEFLVKWKGYPKEQASWVVEDDLGLGCADMMSNILAEKHRKEALDAGCAPKEQPQPQHKESSKDDKSVEKILGAVREGKSVMLLVKWQGQDQKELVPSSELRNRNPQKLIEFYQSKLKFI